jgi:CDP-diacylglycerol---serine O-phosphatidyltransferase
MPTPILRQLDLPNFFTLTGLMLSLISAILAIQNNFYAALICMIYAGLTDMLDGVVARQMVRTELQSEVGKQLDSIVDVCSFGFAPAIFAYCFGLQDWLSVTILIFYVGVNALRLAYFNSTGLTRDEQSEYFTGLPVTYAALFIPLTFTASFLLSDSTMKWVLDGVYLLLAIAMVANFKMIKLRGIWYGIFALGAIALTGVYSWAIIMGG